MVAESTELGFHFLLPVGLHPLLSKGREREGREQMVYIHQRPKVQGRSQIRLRESPSGRLLVAGGGGRKRSSLYSQS